jgi:hypothetical protein
LRTYKNKKIKNERKKKLWVWPIRETVPVLRFYNPSIQCMLVKVYSIIISIKQ